MKKIFLFLGLAGLALGQQSLNNIGQINWTTPGLSPVSSVSAYVQGSGGTANYYYWVVAKFSAGNATPSTPAFVSGASNNLGGSQCNIVTWSGVTGATSYDLLRYSSSSLPNSGNLLVTNTSGFNYSDCSPSTSSYTVNSYVPQNCSWSIAANGQISLPCTTAGSVTPNIPLAATSSLGTVISANAYGVSQALACIATSGSGTSYVCSTSPTVTPPLNELQINFKVDVANTGTSATLQFNTGTTSPISVNGSTTLVVGALTAGWHYAIFDGTNWQVTSSIGNVAGTGPTGSGKLAAFTNTSGTAITQVANGSTGSLNAVNDFGADPTGTNNSFTAFTNMAASGKSVYVPCGTYTATNATQTGGIQITANNTNIWSDCQPTITVNLAAVSSAYFQSAFWGEGTFTDYPGTIVGTDTFPPLINLASGSLGSTMVTCSTTGCVPSGTAGTWIMIAEGASPKWDTYRQYVQVLSVDGTNSVMTLAQPTTWAVGSSSTNAGFIRITPLQNVSVRGLAIAGNSNLTGYYGIYLQLSANAHIANNHLLSPFGFPIGSGNSTDTIVENNIAEYNISGICDYSTNAIETKNIYRNAGSSSEECSQGAYDISINNNIYNSWVGTGGAPLIGTGQARVVDFKNNLVNGTGATAAYVFSMSAGDDISVDGNHFTNVSQAIINGCASTPSLSAPIACRRLSVTNNTVSMAPSGTCVSVAGSSAMQAARITGNVCTNVSGAGIAINGGGANPTNTVGWLLGGNVDDGDNGYYASAGFPTGFREGYFQNTNVSGSVGGVCGFQQNFFNVQFKRVSIYCSNLTGTASYTFPNSFSNKPGIFASSTLTSGVVTSLSTSAVTITGTASTGTIVLEGN